MNDRFPNNTVSLDVEELGEVNAEFLGTFRREDQVCDYYLVTTESGLLYYYVPRSEAEEINDHAE